MERLKKLIEDLDWKVGEVNFSDGIGWEISQYSPAGEDFCFIIEHNNDIKKAIEEIVRYSNVFDTEEHIDMWAKAKQNGIKDVPSYRTLVEDAHLIENMLHNLASEVKEIIIEEPEKGFYRKGFMKYIKDKYNTTNYEKILIDTLIDYAQDTQHVSKGMFVNFLAKMIPFVDKEEIIRFCEKDILSSDMIKE